MTLLTLNNNQQSHQVESSSSSSMSMNTSLPQQAFQYHHQQEQTPQKYVKQINLPRRPALSTSKVPSNLVSNYKYYNFSYLDNSQKQVNNTNNNNNTNINKTNQKQLNSSSLSQTGNNNLVKSNHFNSSECLLTSQANTSTIQRLNFQKLKQNNTNNIINNNNLDTATNNSNNQSNITSSISSSIISSSTTTSGFVSGSNSISNSISLSSSKSNDFLNPNDTYDLIAQKNLNYSNLNKNHLDNLNDNKAISRSIYEFKMKPLNSDNQIMPTKTRIASFQPSLLTNSRLKSTNGDIIQIKSQKSPNYKKLNDIQSSNVSLTNSSQYYIDSTGPISSSSRHASTNSSKVLSHVIITPRNSTSTVLIDSNEPNTSRSTRNSMTDQSRRLSQCQNYIKVHQQKWIKRNSNYCENDDIDDDFVNELEDGLNYDEDDDIFDYNENSNEPTNKHYNNSLSTASCIANEINCLNTYNITPDTSTSASSSSFSSSSANPVSNLAPEPSRIVLTSQKINSPTLIKQSVNRSLNTKNQTITPSSNTSTSSYPSTPDIFQKSRNKENQSSSMLNKSVNVNSSASTKQNSKSIKQDLIETNLINRQYKIQQLASSSSQSPLSSSAQSPLPPPLPTTIQSFFNHNSNTNDYSIAASLKNFSHFDVQSIFFNYPSIKSIISSLHTSMNIKTGASAASRQSSLESLNKTLPPLLIQNQHLIKQQQQQQNIIKPSNSQLIQDDKSSKIRLSSSLYIYDQNTCPTSPKIPKPSENKPIFNLNSNDSNLNEMPDLNDSVHQIKNCDLVEECNCFRLEVGGDAFKGLGLVQDVSQRRMMKLNSVNILDKINSHYKKEIIDLIEANNNEPFTIEHQDWGSYFYRYYFSNQDHANYLGIDRDIGPVAISIRRDKLIVEPPPRANSSTYTSSGNNTERVYDYAYRFIMRTSDLNTLRGTILEEHINTKNSNNSNKGIAHKEVINFLMPNLSLSCLRLADSKITDKLIELDEQYLIKNHKIGILLCKAGQSTEEEMYNNKETTPAFDEFLQLLGEKVCLKGFYNYRGGLDNTNDTTGTHSVYTKFRNKEIMFHVSTLLPYSNNDRQQLTRKRHIGNDLVTIIFQEPGSLPFSPKTIRSQYQHIFIIVRAMNPNSYNTQYSVAVSYSKDIPAFGPPLPKNPLFLKSKEFREFLLAKIVNADNVGLKCEKFTQIRMRTRNGTLKDLVDSYSTKFTLDNCANGAANMSTISQKFGLFNFGSIKQKKLRSKSLQAFNASINNCEESNAINLFKLNGSIFWNVEIVEDFQYLLKNCCLLGISKQNIVVVDAQQKSVLFSIGCNAVIGWTLYEHENSIVLYFDLGECINIKLKCKSELLAVIKRLEFFTKGCKTIELSLEKKDCGPLGFNIHHDGVVTEVEPYSLAYYRGLKQGTRIVKIGDHFVINLNHEKMIDLLRNSACLKITFLMPFDDGSARRGQDDSFSLYAYLSTCSSLNERQIDSIKTTPILTNFQKFNRTNLPSVSLFSPQKNRRLTTSSNISKIISRLSTSGSTSENNEIDLKDINDTNTNTTNTNENKSNSTVFSNSIYFGCDNSNQSNNPVNIKKDVTVDRSTNIQPPKKIFTSNSIEWSKMVQKASKAFENAHRCSDNIFFNDTTSRPKLNSTCVSGYYNNNYKNDKIKANIDLKECIEHNLEKNASYDELKERLLHLQLELNKEKQEKSKIVKQEAHIREEYLNLQQEYLRIKERLLKENQNSISSVNITPSSRRYSNKNEFVDCASDIKIKQGTTPQVLRLNNDSFFPNHNYSNDSHI